MVKTFTKYMIAEADTARATKWQNNKVTWETFIMKFKTPGLKCYKMQQYKNMNKECQGVMKEGPSFFGGFLLKGSRKIENVKNRCLLYYDIEGGTGNIDTTIKKLNIPYEFFLHTTHSHEMEKPRYRIIIPLLNIISNREQFEFITRIVADILKLENVDTTCHDYNRLMFYPEIPSDMVAEYRFYHSPGEFLNPEPFFEEYPDWKDIPWPDKKVKAGKKNEDGKKLKSNGKDATGVIGAVCRQYNCPQIIDEFLSGTYSQGDRGRYTYTPGGSANGLQILDDGELCLAWDYTNPAKGMKNPYDLILYNVFPEDAAKDPQEHTACFEWCLKNMEKVKADEQYIKEQERWKEINKWDKEFISIAKDGTVTPIFSATNLKKALEYKKIKLRYNELSYKKEINGADWDSESLTHIIDICQHYRFKAIPNPNYLKAFVNRLAKEDKFNPIKDYLENLPKWDGVKRVDHLLSTYFDAPDDAYTRAVIRKTLAGAVKRIYSPGCEMQTMLVLLGKTGIGKSYFWELLAKGFFNDRLKVSDMTDKKALESIMGYWFIEVAELVGMRKTDENTIKSFITAKKDIERLSYREDPEVYPRACILVGTTNESYLKDVTGNRRFWTVEVNERKTDKLNVDQIWAEVLTYWETEDLRLPEELVPYAEKIADKYMDTDERKGLVEVYLNEFLPKNWVNYTIEKRIAFFNRYEGSDDSIFTEETGIPRTEVTVIEIWCECFKRDKSEIQRRDSVEIVKILKSLSWEIIGPRYSVYGSNKTFRK